MLARMHRLSRFTFVLFGAFVLSACGALRFHDAWTDYAPSTERTPLDGRWRGEWRSEWNGHAGGLHCLITRQDDEHVHAWFYSTYSSILFFQHELDFQLSHEPDGALHFAGEKDLGAAIGGVYRYTGTVVGDEFRATFEAQNGDHGVFEMTRVE